MQSCEVSVIMAVYNEEEAWLRKSIESILNQSFKDFEFIIVLDNPNNEKLENIILEYKDLDERIVFVKNPKNLGLIESLNKALKLTKGKYIARMDADDISELNRLEIQHNFMKKNKDISLIGASIIQIDEEDNILDDNWKLSTNSKAIKKYLKYTNVVVHPTYFFRRAILENGIEGYRNMPCCEDYDFVCRVVAKGYNISNVGDKLLRYRIRKTSISRDKTLQQLYNANYLKNIYKHQLKNGEDIYTEEELYTDSKIDSLEKNKFKKSEELKEKALELQSNNKKISGKLMFIRSKLVSKYAYKNAMSSGIYKFLLKVYK